MLSTCHRTEFYVSTDKDSDAIGVLHELLREQHPNAPVLELEIQRYLLSELDAARHLFRVSCGLESALLGDRQILGQVRAAYNTAVEQGTSKNDLARLFSAAFKAGKRARAETKIGCGSASIGAAVVEAFSARHPDPGSNILILGAGEAARSIATNAKKQGYQNIVLINRTFAKAEALARQVGARACPDSELSLALLDAHVVVAATGAKTPVLDRAQVEQLSLSRRENPPLLIDAGMPRNIATDGGLAVLDVDSLSSWQSDGFSTRQESIAHVEAIVEEELAALAAKRASSALDGIIQRVYGEAEALSLACAETLATHQSLEARQRAVASAMKKLLHRHISELRVWNNTARAGG